MARSGTCLILVRISFRLLLISGFWPASDRRTVKTELEIDAKTQLPPISTQDRLIE
jgi:hypothetical protein